MYNLFVLSYLPRKDKISMKKFEIQRYETGKNGMEIDRFIRAWIMIKGIAFNGGKFFKKSHIRTMKPYMADLCLDKYPDLVPSDKVLLENEWKSFALKLYDNYFKDPSYSSKLMGLIHADYEELKLKVRYEINLVAKDYPVSLGLGDLFAPLYQIMSNTYEEYLNRD